MIRLAEDDLLTMRRRAVSPPAEGQWKQWQQGLQEWVRTRPELALALAATAGAVLAWAIKRRT
ncbi:MAG TPA: hypothetical protein VM165_00105 [Planctomycetaceae bacterium]|nr:hypothetical protein [Planctomycetaceae bacterium]